MPAYKPPFEITTKILNLSTGIGEEIGGLSVLQEQAKDLKLRKINRIRTIQGSLAIEGNTLSEEQITAILDGKRVIAPPREVQEARNAILAYESFSGWQFDSEEDLLSAHAILMKGLLDLPGRYRAKGVGVMSGDRVIHMAPPADRVGVLMSDLFGWLKGASEHPLIVSSVFHYEFEFIHPFDDGNGRMGRLWQTLILSRWNKLFEYIPVESIIHENQADYYDAIQASTDRSNSAPFIEFMLEMILEAIVSGGHLAPQDTPQVTPQVEKLMQVLVGEMSRDELQGALGLTDRKSFRQRYLQPALEAGLIEMTIPEKPSSRSQRYRRC